MCFDGKSSSFAWGKDKDKDKDKKKSSKDGKTKTTTKGKAAGGSSKHDSEVPEWAVASCDKVRFSFSYHFPDFVSSMSPTHHNHTIITP